jgi:hypothetical protein
MSISNLLSIEKDPVSPYSTAGGLIFVTGEFLKINFSLTNSEFDGNSTTLPDSPDVGVKPEYSHCPKKS